MQILCLPPIYKYFQYSSTRMETQRKLLTFITSKGNEIWLSSLSLSWQQYHKQTKFQVQVPEAAVQAKLFIQSLKNLKCSPQDVDNSVYYRAGAKTQAANAINKDLQQNFPQQSIQKVGSLKHDQVIFYGSMYKVIKLAYPFYDIPGKIMHFRRNKVPCFQPYTAQQRKQVFVVKYTNEDNFMVRIDTLQKDSQMFLIMSKSKFSLDEVFELVRKSDDQVQPMTNNDIFKIPQLKIKASNVNTNLSCAKIKFQKQPKKYQIAQLVQCISLEMHGQQQNDNIDDLTLTVPEAQNPKLKERRMCLRDPFWMVLKYKGCNPYFAIYINKATDVPA